ncbi:MAG: ATP-binding cassette domain-containing protein [Ostreibacterium sp.]
MTDIKLNKVTVSYHKKTVLNQLNISISTQGISFVIGENGAGKTQLMRVIHGLITPDSGQVNAPPTRSQAYLRQNPILLNRSVMSNLQFIRNCPACPVDIYEHRIDSVIEQFNLEHLLQQPILTLSGGQKKRVACARLWLQNADCYLLDEPSANIDHQHNLIIETAIETLANRGKKVILSSHDFFQIERLFKLGRDELLVIKKGQLVKTLTQLDPNHLKGYWLL